MSLALGPDGEPSGGGFEPLDWGLAFLLVVMAALALAGRGDARSRRAGVADVRSLELPAKLTDGERSLAPAIRDAIGLSGQPDEDMARQLAELRRDVASRAPWSAELRLTVTALAVAFSRDQDARAELQHLAPHEALTTEWRELAAALGALAAGGPAPDIDVLVAELQRLGASWWLVERVRARHFGNAGELGEQALAAESAQLMANDLVATLQLGGVIVIALFALGGLFLIAWPFIRRTVLGAGFTGLPGPRSAFAVRPTFRVVAGWVVAAQLLGWSLVFLLGNAAMSAQDQAMLIAFETLLHGGIAVSLIQRFGRRLGDPSPLSLPLRLGVAHAPRRWRGLLLWLVVGPPVALFVAVGAMLLNSLLDLDGGAQTSLQLLIEASPEARIFLWIAAGLFAPVFEELLFRGFLFQNLRQRFGSTTAMLLSGLAFGAVHLDPGHLLPLTALGAALAFLYERSGTLLVPIAVHACWNVATIATTITVSG